MTMMIMMTVADVEVVGSGAIYVTCEMCE